MGSCCCRDMTSISSSGGGATIGLATATNTTTSSSHGTSSRSNPPTSHNYHQPPQHRQRAASLEYLNKSPTSSAASSPKPRNLSISGASSSSSSSPHLCRVVVSSSSPTPTSGVGGAAAPTSVDSVLDEGDLPNIPIIMDNNNNSNNDMSYVDSEEEDDDGMDISNKDDDDDDDNDREQDDAGDLIGIVDTPSQHSNTNPNPNPLSKQTTTTTTIDVFLRRRSVVVGASSARANTPPQQQHPGDGYLPPLPPLDSPPPNNNNNNNTFIELYGHVEMEQCMSSRSVGTARPVVRFRRATVINPSSSEFGSALRSWTSNNDNAAELTSSAPRRASLFSVNNNPNNCSKESNIMELAQASMAMTSSAISGVSGYGATARIVSELIRSRDDFGHKNLNEYAVIADLGHGSYAKVKLAIDTTVDRPVAIKILRRGTKPKDADVIQQEITVMQRLHHPNIVALHAVIDDPNSEKVYMVLEYVPGGTLTDLVAERKESAVATAAATFDAATFRTRFLDVLHGLQYLHNHNVVHMDIKPENILVGED
eukprot:PhM_4_TR18737/c7_g3_i1/m.65854